MPLSADDRLAIHELIALHGHMADDRRDDQLHLLLTKDASYDISAYGMGVVQGLDALTRLFSERPGEQPVGHHVTNVIVSTTDAGDSDTATVRSKGLAVMADGACDTVVYEDAVVRTPAGWRIARRTIIPTRRD
jgi:hypothetical protein